MWLAAVREHLDIMGVVGGMWKPVAYRGLLLEIYNLTLTAILLVSMGAMERDHSLGQSPTNILVSGPLRGSLLTLGKPRLDVFNPSH